MKLSSLKSPDGEFELHVKIGEGNYGSVYKVISYLLYSKFSIFQFSIQHLVSNWKKKKKGAHTKKKTVVAIKVLEFDEEDHEDLEIEINILQQCHHPNIVEYYGTYTKFSKIWVIFSILSKRNKNLLILLIFFNFY